MGYIFLFPINFRVLVLQYFVKKLHIFWLLFRISDWHTPSRVYGSYPQAPPGKEWYSWSCPKLSSELVLSPYIHFTLILWTLPPPSSYFLPPLPRATSIIAAFPSFKHQIPTLVDRRTTKNQEMQLPLDWALYDFICDSIKLASNNFSC